MLFATMVVGGTRETLREYSFNWFWTWGVIFPALINWTFDQTIFTQISFFHLLGFLIFPFINASVEFWLEIQVKIQPKTACTPLAPLQFWCQMHLPLYWLILKRNRVLKKTNGPFKLFHLYFSCKKSPLILWKRWESAEKCTW